MAQAKFYQSQQEELQFLLRQLLNHDLYSVLPELNQTPSMYNYEPSYNIRPANLPNPHKMKLTAETVNDTAQVRGRRGFGSILAKAIPGLITLAIQSVSSYIKGKQQQRINTAVEELRNDDNKIKNDLKQYRNELLMYGRYNLKSLRGIINTINALHDKQNHFEWAVKQKYFNFRKSDMDAVNYNFEVMMYMKNVREEHVVTYREAVKATRDLLDGIAIVTQGRLPRALFSDNQLREILGKVDAMVKRNYPDYVLAAKHISHYRDMKMVTFVVDQQAHSLILTFPAFIKNYKQPPLSLYEVETVPVPILGYLVLAYAITQFFRPVTWCKGYKYNKKCALYIFVYDEDHERYSPLKIMSLKGQMHNYRMKYTGEGISLTLVRSWTYDTMTISWRGVQVMDKIDPINLPATVTVALRHKIMTRRIAQQLGEVQYMLKQGSSGHDITDYYRARKKAVNLRVESGDRGVTSSPKKVRKEKSLKKTKVQEEPVEV